MVAKTVKPQLREQSGPQYRKPSLGINDMNSVQNNELTFHNTTFSHMEMSGQVWLTAIEIGRALGYADEKAVQRIYSRHADEFTDKMTGVVKVTTPRGMQESRVFSLRGAHLIAMFSRTPIAKEFRRWVLDILDREVAQGNAHPAFDFEMAAYNARAISMNIKVIKEIWRGGLEEALRLMDYRHGGEISERLADLSFFTAPLEESLSKHEKKGRIH